MDTGVNVVRADAAPDVTQGWHSLTSDRRLLSSKSESFRLRVQFMRRSTFLLGVLLLLSSAEAAPQFAVEVTASRLNVRNRVMGSILGQVDQGDRLVVTAQSGSWLQIDWGGRSAWISSSYARRTAATIDVVTASYLNVRSGPSTGYSVMGSARGGQGLVVLQRRSGWNLVQFDSRAGWVSSSYTRPFTNGGSSTAPAPPPASTTAGRPRPRSSSRTTSPGASRPWSTSWSGGPSASSPPSTVAWSGSTATPAKRSGRP